MGIATVVFYLFLRKLFENDIENVEDLNKEQKFGILPKQNIKQPSNVDMKKINEPPEDCYKENIEE